MVLTVDRMIQYFYIIVHNFANVTLFSQGDGLEFKRHFLKIKAQLKDIIDR